MKRSNIGFPYPVLCADNNDYIDSEFNIIVVNEPIIENNVISLCLQFSLKSKGLENMLSQGEAKVLVYSESSTSSFRETYEFSSGETEMALTFDATKLTKNLTLKGLVVANQNYENLGFEEHNKELFNETIFKVNKGDILAISNIFEIELDIIDPLANKPSIFSIRPDDEATQSIRVDISESEKINIWLKRDLHNEYQELREEPKIRVLLASYYVLPALVEALNFMVSGAKDGDNEDIRNGGWFQSLEARINTLGINLEEENSMTSVANMILNDIIQESMTNFKYIKDNLAGN